MVTGTILNFAPRRPDTLVLHTADWSAAELSHAPEADRIIAAYESRFDLPVRASQEVASTGAPQLELVVDTSDLPWLDRARRRLLAGEPRSEEDRETWHALSTRIRKAKEMHDTLSPEFHFPFTAAAAIAVTEAPVDVTYTSVLIGYRALLPGEGHAQNIDMDTPAPMGTPAQDRFEEGGHLFKFRKLRESNTGTIELVHSVLICSTGFHVGRGQGDPRKNGALSVLDNRRHRMPAFLEPLPEFDRTLPPPEYRISLVVFLPYGAKSTEHKIEDLERSLGIVIAPGGNDAKREMGTIHIDLTDLRDWPRVRDLLLAGAEIREGVPILREAVKRTIDVVAKTPRAHLSDTAAILTCLSRARSNLEVASVRLAGVQYIHPYQLEKLSNWSHYPDAPAPPPTGPVAPAALDEPPRDFGVGCLFEIDGGIERGWFEP